MGFSYESLLADGLALIPIERGLKGPRAYEWNRIENVITCPTDAHLLKGKNVGLAHAYCRPIPTCAIDIDNGRLATRYLRQAGIDLLNLINTTNAPALYAGNPKKMKLIFKLPSGSDPLVTRTVKVKKEMVLEFRCASSNGRTVQDLLPGSLHPSNQEYRLLKGSLSEIPVIPTELLKHWNQLIEARSIAKQPPKLQSSDDTPRARARLISALSYISADCDYETWRNVVWGVIATGFEPAVEIAEEWSRTVPERFDQRAFDTLISSYDDTHTKPVTAGTVFHLAKCGGWNAC